MINPRVEKVCKIGGKEEEFLKLFSDNTAYARHFKYLENKYSHCKPCELYHKGLFIRSVLSSQSRNDYKDVSLEQVNSILEV